MKDMYPIERGIPAPVTRPGYPFSKLEIGDSFTAPLSKLPSLRSIAPEHGKRFGKRFSVSGKGGIARVWRTA